MQFLLDAYQRVFLQDRFRRAVDADHEQRGNSDRFRLLPQNVSTEPFTDHGLWRGRIARSRVAIEVTGAPIKLFKEFKEDSDLPYDVVADGIIDY